MSKKIVCDLCLQEQEFEEAIAWYEDNEGNQVDVCEKHMKQAKAYGFEITEY